MKIVVLAGGLCGERNVSLCSGAMVAQALRKRGHRVALVDLFFGLEHWNGAPEDLYDAPIPEAWLKISRTEPDLKAVRASRRDQSSSLFGEGVLELCKQADVAFLALHGDCGEDGRLQAALDMHGIVYTGSDYISSAIAMDKNLTKQMVKPTGVPTPMWKTISFTADEMDSVMQHTQLPVVVKPNMSGSSIGVEIARTQEELRHALQTVLDFGGACVLEQYVQGREIQIAILEDGTLPSIEIIPKTGFYDYENKYQPDAAEEICPAPIPSDWEAKLSEYALTVFHTLGLAVYSRVDFIVTEDGTPWFLEINTLPGMTPTSLVPQEAAAAGISYEDLCERIVNASVKLRRG